MYIVYDNISRFETMLRVVLTLVHLCVRVCVCVSVCVSALCGCISERTETDMPET